MDGLRARIIGVDGGEAGALAHSLKCFVGSRWKRLKARQPTRRGWSERAGAFSCTRALTRGSPGKSVVRTSWILFRLESVIDFGIYFQVVKRNLVKMIGGFGTVRHWTGRSDVGGVRGVEADSAAEGTDGGTVRTLLRYAMRSAHTRVVE